MLQSTGSQRFGHDLVTERQQCAVSNATERNMMFKIKMVVEQTQFSESTQPECAVVCYRLSKSSF